MKKINSANIIGYLLGIIIFLFFISLIELSIIIVLISNKI